MDFKEKLKKKADNIGIPLSEIQLKQFHDFYDMLIEKNKVMNLTSITEEDEVIDKHFIDSLSCVRVINMSHVKSVIDIGTGAGFPGIPLKIAYPDIDFVLLDSLGKRVRFLNEAIQSLHLDKIQALHGRAEDLARKAEFRGKFDLCVSRAVANLNTLSEYSIPFLRVNGFFVSYKARKGLEEIHEVNHCMEELGSKIIQVDEFKLTDMDSDRVLIKIKKCKGTSKLYPRKAGIPSKNPL